ncbi:MAG: O-antigen ligase family protein [Patescibacteria group bacterium]
MKKVAWWVAVVALFAIPFLSLYVANGSYFPFITGKNFFFRVLVEIAFGAWTILAFADRRYRPRFSWTLAWYKTFVFWMLIAVFFAVNPHKAFWSNFERMDGWITLIHLYLFMLVASSILSVDTLWRKWWLAFTGGAALVTVYGLMQMTGMATISQSADRIDSTLGNAEYLAGYLLFAIAIALWQAFETRGKDYAWLKYGLFVLAALELVVLFQTGTRGSFIALIGAGVVGSVLWMLEAGKRGRKGAVALFAVLVLLVGGLFAVRNSAFVHASPNLDRLASAFSLKQALGTRFTIWHMAVEGIQARPVTGWGQEGYNYVFNTYYEPSMYGQEPWFDRAHDMFLDWAVAGGIPALLLFLAVLLSAAYGLYRAPVSRSERIFLLAALTGYVIQGLVVFDNLFTYLPFVAILAMAHKVRSRPIALMERWPEVGKAPLTTVIAPLAAVVVILVIWFVNVPSVSAGGDLIGALTPSNDAAARLGYFKKAVNDGSFAHQEIAEQLANFAPTVASNASVPDAQRAEVATYAVQEMQRQLADTPLDARLHVQYALLLRSIGRIKDAQAESARARELSPRKQTIILEQGLEAFQSNDYAGAETFFKDAYALDTHDTDIVPFIAGSLIAQHDVAGGKALLAQTFGTTTLNQSILLLAYYQIQDWDDLISIVKAHLAQQNDAATGFQLAAIYSAAGRRADAVAQVNATIAAHPESASQGAAVLQQLGITK